MEQPPLSQQPPVCVYAGFDAGWEKSTGVPLTTVVRLAERFRDGISEKLRARGVAAQPSLVLDTADIPVGALVVNACALGNETAASFAAARACAAPPVLWDWVSPKHTYMAALAEAGIPIPHTWHVTADGEGGIRVTDLQTDAACVAERSSME
eukprot:2398050-Prymnesium_polylepis.1